MKRQKRANLDQEAASSSVAGYREVPKQVHGLPGRVFIDPPLSVGPDREMPARLLELLERSKSASDELKAASSGS